MKITLRMDGWRTRLVGEDPRDFLEFRQGSGRTIEIYDLQVTSKRRAGIGRALVNHLMSEAQSTFGCRLVWAMTRATNQIAQEFYEGLGFRVVGVLRGFYQDQGLPDHMVDAILYGRDLRG